VSESIDELIKQALHCTALSAVLCDSGAPMS